MNDGFEMTWQEYLRTMNPLAKLAAREALAKRYVGLLEERLELGCLVGAGRRDEPVHRWVPYKEAFSPGLVRDILDYLGEDSGVLLDPFAGVGTSLLVANERGMTGIGVELLPYPAFAASTKLGSGLANPEKVRRLAAATASDRRRPVARFPDFPVREWAFEGPVLGQLCRLDSSIGEMGPGIEQDLCRLALLSTVEQVSQATKDGTSLRRRKPGNRHGRWGISWTAHQVRDIYLRQSEQFATDLGSIPYVDSSLCHLGDARRLPPAITPHSVSTACFSPPYPNRYDYTANYQLEMGFGFCSTRADLKELRKAQLKSHLECPWSDKRTVESESLDEFLAALAATRQNGDQVGRVLRMVSGYFEDMAQVFTELERVMQPGGHIAIVVASQVFGGQALPTDLILAELAEEVGFVTKSIWVARHKGIATQQRLRYGSIPGSRESIVLLQA